MADLPLITVVTPSYNQGKFIARTVESVLAQGYPNVQHVVVDGLSTDDTPAVLARYPHLEVVREADSGQADAINKGFRRARGAIHCFLNSDDTFLPGALHRVAREVDPARGRHVVVGRCLYVDEEGRPTGLEHPCAFVGHEELLRVWKVHCVPQPATFWTAEAWRRCGPLDEGEHLVPDYDWMCRLSRRYPFHVIDALLATYRYHPGSKSCSHSPDDIYSRATRVSRRYWGPRWLPRYWRLLVSLGLFRLERRWGRRSRAAALTVRARRALEAGSAWRALGFRAASALLAPEDAWRRRRLFGRAPGGAYTWDSRGLPPRATAWRSFTGRHADGTVGPRFVSAVDVPPGARALRLDGTMIFPARLPGPLAVSASLDGGPGACARLTGQGPFSLAVPVEGLAPGGHELEVTSSWFMVPDDYWGNEDFRPLAFRLDAMQWTGGVGKAA